MRGGLGGTGRVTGAERRQAFELLPVKVMVTEHQLIECGCGHGTRAGRRGAESPGSVWAPGAAAPSANPHVAPRGR